MMSKFDPIETVTVALAVACCVMMMTVSLTILETTDPVGIPVPEIGAPTAMSDVSASVMLALPVTVVPDMDLIAPTNCRSVLVLMLSLGAT